MSVSELRRLKELEEDNRRLKQLDASLSLEHEVLKDPIEKSAEVEERHELVKYAMDKRELTARQAGQKIRARAERK